MKFQISSLVFIQLGMVQVQGRELGILRRSLAQTPSPTISPTISPTSSVSSSMEPTYVGEYTGDRSAPPYTRPGSQEPVDSCPTLTNEFCNSDGSSNYHVWDDVTYDSTTGYFTATLTTNSCNAFDGGPNATPHSAYCVQQTFPDSNFDDENMAYQMPLLGDAAWSIHGVNIYSPYENGFWEGQLCDGASAHGGMDITVLDAFMTDKCPNNTITNSQLLLDECGAHAEPYHYHEDLRCAYNHSVLTHSPLIGIAMTGQGVYGKFESDLQVPTDLDECGGHYGPVPASDDLGTESSEHVYHYHVQDTFPFTLGCFGPLDQQDDGTSTTCTELNAEACQEMDPVTLPIMVDGETESIEYRYWCPCKSDNMDAWTLSDSSDAMDRARKDRARKMRQLHQES